MVIKTKAKLLKMVFGNLKREKMNIKI